MTHQLVIINILFTIFNFRNLNEIHPSNNTIMHQHQRSIKGDDTVNEADAEDLKRILRAAGSRDEQSLQLLKEETERTGWTGKQLDSLSETGKTPLQAACWKGNISTVKYLLDVVKCDVNVYSKQKFSYGKTAIFFALTQSRRDMVEYLLSRSDIQVAIVNNKGQSVLSLAASHDMPESVLKRIKALEEGQTWLNFRETHSDGLEYGDLDPRFFKDRPLRDTDTVSEYAINGTTEKTRKGGFERRNPNAVKEWQKLKQQQNQSKNIKDRKKRTFELSVEEQGRLDHAWNVLKQDTDSEKEITEHEALVIIVRLNDQLRQAWIPQTVHRLLDFGFDPNQITELLVANEDIEIRIKSLLKKLHAALIQAGDPSSPLEEETTRDKAHSKKPDPSLSRISKHSIELKMFYPLLKGLNIAFLIQQADNLKLSLPIAPVWIDQTTSLTNFFHELKLQSKEEPSLLIAIDTEWYQPENSSTPELSTLQLALYSSSNEFLSVFLVDLIVHDSTYRELAVSLICWLLRKEKDESDTDTKKGHWVLGFSIGRDISMLDSFCKNHAKIHSSIDREHDQILDLQPLLSSRYFQNKKGQLPGLQRCVELYTTDSYLCKKEQCSDWSKRPLSKSQLKYAGLDAAILLVLLAEESQRREMK